MLPELPWTHDVAKLSRFLATADRLAIAAGILTILTAIFAAAGTISRIHLGTLLKEATARRDGPRHVPIDQSTRTSIVAHLSAGSGTSLHVAAIAGSSEAEAFALEFCALLRDAGWFVEGPGKLVTTELPPRNSLLRVSNHVDESTVELLRQTLDCLNSPTTVIRTDADSLQADLWLGLH